MLLALIAAFALVVGISELMVAIGGKRPLERDLKNAVHRRVSLGSRGRTARRSDSASTSATAGREQPPGIDAVVRRARTVAPSATATPAATRQSSPTMKFHQKRPNERRYLMPRPPRNGACRTAAQRAHENERKQREERDHAEQRELVAGPVDAGALRAPEAAEAGEQEADGELDRVLGHARERPLREDPRDDHDHECERRRRRRRARAGPERCRRRSR